MINISLQNENISLQNQIEKIKQPLSNQIKEKVIINDRMKKIINSGFDNNDTQKIIILRMKIKNNEDKISRVNAAIKKAESYVDYANYTNIILKNDKPIDKNEINSYNKLKNMLDDTKDIPKYYNNLGNNIDLLTSNDMSFFSE